MVRTILKVVGKPGLSRTLNCMLMICVAGVMVTSTAYGAFFDTAGQSARPMGMGEVFLSSVGDPSAYWYNPAGLSKFENRMAGLSYGIINPSIADDLMNYGFNVVMPVGGASGIGLGVSGLTADGANEMVFSGAYGVALGERLSLGASAKVLYWSSEGQPDPYNGVDDEDLSKASFSLDVSAMYALGEMFGLGEFATGVYVKDAIMPNISEGGEDDGKLPVEAGIGLMVQRDELCGEFDVAVIDGNTIFRAGAESGITGTDLKLRAGFVYGSDFEDDTEQTEVDLGVGYSFSSLVFNYAYNLPLHFNNTGGRHFVSFGVSF